MKAYVFPNSIRKFRYFSFFSVVIFAAFSLFMWYITYTQEGDQIPAAVIATLFTVLTPFSALVWMRTSKQLNIQYRIENGVAENLLGDLRISVEIESAVHTQIVLTPFYIGKGNMNYLFTLLSNNINPNDLLNKTSSPMKMFKLLWASNVVVVPSDASPLDS